MPASKADAGSPRDHGPFASLVLGALALAFGAAVGALAALDGRFGWLWQPRLLGPAPAFLNDVPFLGVLVAAAVAAAVAWFLAWVRACGSWDRPLLGLLAFSFFADVVPALFQISIVLVFLVLADRAIRRGDLPLRLSPLLLPVALILVGYTFTFLSTPRPAVGLIDFQYRVLFLGLVGILPVLLRTPRQLDLLLRFMIVAACLSTLTALAQFGLSFVSGQVITFGDQTFDRFLVGGLVFPRCTGLMYHPNHAANTLASTAVIVLYFATGPRARMPRARRLRYLAVYAFLALGVAITWSRSGWLTLGLATLLIPLLRWPRLALAYLGGLGLLAALGWQSGILPALYDFVVELNKGSADFRWHIDRIALHAFREHPLAGVGVEGMLLWFNPYPLQVHNTYLQVVAEMGLFGLAAFALLSGWLALRVARALRAAADPRRREWLIALILASAVLLVQNLFEMFLWIKYLWFWIGLIEAAVLVCLQPVRDDDPDQVAFLPATVPDGS